MKNDIFNSYERNSKSYMSYRSLFIEVPLNVVVIILKYNDFFAIRMKYVTIPPLGYMNQLIMRN